MVPGTELPIEYWFYNEVFKWRCGASVWWTAIFSIIISTLYILLSYLLTLSDYFSALFTLYSFLFVLFALGIHILMAIYNTTQCTVLPRISVTRLGNVVAFFKPKCILQCIFFIMSSIFITIFASWIMKPTLANLTLPCAEKSEGRCLNEHKLFLIVVAIYQGLLYHLHYYVNQYEYTHFLIIQQAKFFHIKSQLFPIFIESIKLIFKQLVIFYPVFYILGYLPRDMAASILGLEISSNASLSSINNLLQPDLFLQALLLGTYVYFLWNLSILLLKTYITESYEFSIESGFQHLSNKCLHNALTCKINPWVQYLGFQDLFQLSRFSFARRQVIFSATFPGCHPKNWTKIYHTCLETLTALKDSTQEFNHNAFVSAAVPQHNTSNWLIQNSAAPVSRYMKPTSVGNISLDETVNGALHKEEKTKISLSTKIWDALKKKPVFGYFLRDLPDATARKLFSSVQIHIWSVEGLSSLVAASLIEDSLGIVQQNLPLILDVLLSLYENVERHFKLTSNLGRRSPNNVNTSYDLMLRHAFRSALKSSIYRIVTTFGSCIMDFQLGPEQKRRLKLFLEYKE